VAVLNGRRAGVAASALAAAVLAALPSAAPAGAAAEPTTIAAHALSLAVPAPLESPASEPASSAPALVASAHRTIATDIAAAQIAFDRGLLMLYAFNVGEARLAFRAAEAADPHALMPYVGEAISETIDINRPSTPDGERRGAAAIARGRAALASAPADEAALFAAAALRYDLKVPQRQRFSAYFGALQAYAAAHPADGLGLTLAAYAGWNATDALVAAPGDEPTGDARTIITDLDAALKLDPNDVGAHHLRIHFWEEAFHPERALPDADDLAALDYAPGESHLLHMAGHIFDRLGDFGRMVAVNKGACANDALYFAAGDGDGQRYMRTYHEHDVSFVLYGLTTLGRDAEAAAFAARESSADSEAVALRLHDNAEVLRLLGDAVTPQRVIAEARSGDISGARKDLAALGPGTGDSDLTIAAAVVARAAHDDEAAIAAYRRALAASGSYQGDPKVHWQTPIGEGLGATLLESGDAARAERVFRAELGRYPGDPRLEFGLARALAAQGKDPADAQRAYQTEWQGKHPLTLDDLG
jgi:hypothetical protein